MEYIQSGSVLFLKCGHVGCELWNIYSQGQYCSSSVGMWAVNCGIYTVRVSTVPQV